MGSNPTPSSVNGTANGAYLPVECNPQNGLAGQLISGEASEYLGVIPANQEATEESLAALEAYWQYVESPSSQGVNNGIQPFAHWLMFNSADTVYNEVFDIRGAYSNGNMYVSIDLDDEGDTYQRCLDIYLDGTQLGTCHVIGSYPNGHYNPFTVSLGSLSAGVHTLGIELTTSNYASPSDWWVIGAAINDPPNAGPAGSPYAPLPPPPLSP